METEEKKALLDSFEGMEDPRSRQSPHDLKELLLTAVCAVLSGADGWAAVAVWGRAKLDWLRRFPPFENGAASHDTFGRVFALLDAAVFEGVLHQLDAVAVRGLRGPSRAFRSPSTARRCGAQRRREARRSTWSRRSRTAWG
jgi:hypothetical protein